VNDDAIYKAFNVRIADGSYLFDIATPNGILKDFSFGLPGRHNLMNAFYHAMAKFRNPTDAIAVALALKGVRRRFHIK
jgi:UDP-N-acetylmuramate--alanine ligase